MLQEFERLEEQIIPPAMEKLRIGIVGLGANTRLRHVPGLLACKAVEIAGVVNRTAESTAAAAAEFDIPQSYARWEDLVTDRTIDAVVIGAWPNLHAPVTLAAIEADKHVLTEARMAMSAAEAHAMLRASRTKPHLVTQIVPSPLGLKFGAKVESLLSQGYLGELREVVVLGTNDALADRNTPLHWRQDSARSGVNTLLLGILHETLIRWIPDPMRVTAAAQTFTPHRVDPESGEMATVGTADSLHVIADLPGGARAIYHLSGAIHFGPAPQIHLYGSQGTLKYEFAPDERLLGGQRGDKGLQEVFVPPAQQGRWNVEGDFVGAIRGGKRPRLTDFATGVRYMEFTEAAILSARDRRPMKLPLESPVSGS